MTRPFAMMLCAFVLFASARSVSAESAGQYPLHAAAARDDAAAIDRLLSEGAGLDGRDGSGSTPLLVATRANRVRAARALIDAGADVNAKDRIQDSAYLYAGARGHLEILKMTLAHGPTSRAPTATGGPP